MDPFIGEIKMFGGNYAPKGWAFCDGQILSIAENSNLFAILGITYGGDGRNTFALPDLRGRVAMHAGNGPGLYDRRLGTQGGSEANVLNESQLPPHTHRATGTVRAANVSGTERIPEGFNIAGNSTNEQYTNSATNVDMATDNVTITVNNTGGGQSVNNIQPYQVVNYIIALDGLFPPRS